MTETNDESVGQFLIYGGYGEVMHRLQVLELSLWMIQTRGIEDKIQWDQAIAKVEKWNGTTLGELMRGMRVQDHWPGGLVDKLLRTVDIRNYMALTTYGSTSCSHCLQSSEKAAQELADLSVWLEEVTEELDAHVQSLGIPDVSDLDDETSADIDAMRPKEWFGFPDARLRRPRTG